MKKIYFTLLLFACTFLNAIAQKTYVTATFINIVDNDDRFVAFLSGDVPSNMNRFYAPKDIPKEERPDGKQTAFWIGYILNLLAKEGFTVEQQTTVPQSRTSSSGIIYLLSKPSPDSEKSEKEKKE